MNIILILILFGIGLLNLKATSNVLKNSFLETHQKWFQCLFIWLIPLIGSLLVLSLDKNENTNGNFHEQQSSTEDGFGTDRPEHSYTGINEVDSSGNHF